MLACRHSLTILVWLPRVLLMRSTQRLLQMVSANGRSYATPVAAPVVGICLDGNEEAYVTEAAARGLMPNWLEIQQAGTYGLARACMPTFTNPNNVAIVTGVPPAVNGICGNFLYDKEADTEVMMNEPSFLRAETTILAALADGGTPVYAATAKNKLLRLRTSSCLLTFRT